METLTIYKAEIIEIHITIHTFVPNQLKFIFS